MSRQPRIQFEDALYHIMARGVEKRSLFLDQDDYKKFIELLSELPGRFNIIIYGYVMMENHYHLLVETPLANIGMAMHYLNGVYAWSFNSKYNRIGHLFQARFRSKVIEKETYLLNASRYIHLNPIDIEHLSNLEDYEWSSYSQYIFKKQRVGWLNCEWILGQFSDDTTEAVQMYKNFMNERSMEDDELFGDDNPAPVIGSTEFVGRILKRKMLREANEAKNIDFSKPIATFENILLHVVREFAIDRDDLRIRNNKNCLIRKICIYITRCFTDMSNDSIAQHFGIKRAAVSAVKRRLAEEMRHDNYLKALIDGLIRAIIETNH